MQPVRGKFYLILIIQNIFSFPFLDVVQEFVWQLLGSHLAVFKKVPDLYSKVNLICIPLLEITELETHI